VPGAHKKRPGSPYGDPGLGKHRRLSVGPQRGSHVGVIIGKSEAGAGNGNGFLSHASLHVQVLEGFISLLQKQVKKESRNCRKTVTRDSLLVTGETWKTVTRYS